MLNKDLLIKKLQLSDYILLNDNKAIDIATELKNMDLNDDEIDSIFNNIINYIESGVNYNIIKKVINILNFKGSQYLLSLIDLKLIDINDKETSINFIKSKLNNKIIFRNNMDKYMYYSIIVNITISLKDNNLIKLAIDKIQVL